MKNTIEVRHLGITVKISQQGDTRFVIPDYSTGKRIRHVRSNVSDAKEKAKEVCEALAIGKHAERVILSDSDMRREIQVALKLVKETGTTVDRAAFIFTEAAKLVGVDEIIDPELIPFLLVWNFSGCRKEEISRLT